MQFGAVQTENIHVAFVAVSIYHNVVESVIFFRIVGEGYRTFFL